MYQWVIETFKCHYRSYLLRHMLHESESGNTNRIFFFKSVTMKDVIYCGTQSWEKVKPSCREYGKIVFDVLSTSNDSWEDEGSENISELLKKVQQTIHKNKISRVGCKETILSCMTGWVSTTMTNLFWTVASMGIIGFRNTYTFLIFSPRSSLHCDTSTVWELQNK